MIYEKDDPRLKDGKKMNQILTKIERIILDLAKKGSIEFRHEANKLTIGRPKRTTKQQGAIEVFCRELGETLNAAGIFFRPDESHLTRGVYMLQGLEIPWTQSLVKEKLWRPIQIAFGYDLSTTEIETWQVTKVHNCLMQHLNANMGVEYVEFPNWRSPNRNSKSKIGDKSKGGK